MPSKEDRIIIRVGEGKYNVIAGRKLNDAPLTRAEADRLAPTFPFMGNRMISRKTSKPSLFPHKLKNRLSKNRYHQLLHGHRPSKFTVRFCLRARRCAAAGWCQSRRARAPPKSCVRCFELKAGAA
jgi:hypothetical protein